MATPMTAAEVLLGLKKWNIPYKPYLDWATHNRNHMGPFGPVNGFMIHHTGSDSSDQRSLLYDGRSDLPGPLSQYGIAQDGMVHLIGLGRANHAGKGDPDVLRAVINEDYDKYPPTDNEATVDGNTHFYGVEIWYSGEHDMTDAQYFSLLRLAAMHLDFHNWTAKSAIAHGEWQPGKWDPGISNGKMRDMHVVRTDLAATLHRGPSVPTTPTNPIPPATKSDLYKQVWETDAMPAPNMAASAENPYWMPTSLLKYATEQARQAVVNTEKIMRHLGIE